MSVEGRTPSRVAIDSPGTRDHRVDPARRRTLRSGGRIERAGPKADYECTLWRPALRAAFPRRAPLTRRQAHEPLDALRVLRNRIAHHEPVFARPVREDYDRFLEVTGWISPDVRAWIERHKRVPKLLDFAGRRS